MNGLLLDTHVFIWVVENNPKFPKVVRERIEETENVFVSIASFWEIGIKLKKEKILLSCDFNEIEARFLETDFQLLPISIQDTIQQYNLPFYSPEHKDPFDRIIISQAINRSLPLVSKDQEFDAYPIEKVWA
jgi:PIN domain nuclease of toxin-antitoxin system